MHPLLSRLITLLVLSLALAACGNPGPLYLPAEQTAVGNQESTEYEGTPGPAGFVGEGDDGWQEDADGPAMDEIEAQDAADEEADDEEEAFKKDNDSGS